MLKKGVLGVIAIILIVLALGFVGTGFYFYEYHTFKTLRVCITDETTDTNVTCSTQDDCIVEAMTYKDSPEFQELPIFIKEKIDESINEVVVCNQTCKVKQAYTNFFGEDVRDFESCAENEKEISIEIRGKEGLELLKYLKKVNQ